MRGAWGKPQGTAARVSIGQVIMSVRSKDANQAVVVEALRRSKYKFAGRQKIFVSKKWGFTKLTRDEYLQARSEGRIMPDGAGIKILNDHGNFYFPLLMQRYWTLDNLIASCFKCNRQAVGPPQGTGQSRSRLRYTALNVRTRFSSFLFPYFFIAVVAANALLPIMFQHAPS